MQVQKRLKIAAMSAALTGAVALVPMGASAHTIDQPLQKGAHGKNVNSVQKQLKNEDYYQGQVDGIYGKNTKKAVSQYQKAHDLAKDGIYGTNTSNTMDQAKHHTHKKKKLNNTSLLQHGSQGKAVKALQAELQHLNYYKGNIDSIFGPKTESATKAFQKASDIAVDGIVGPDTKGALENHPVSAHASGSHKSDQQTDHKAKQSSNNHKTKSHHSKASKSKTQHNHHASKTTHHSTSKTKAAHTSHDNSSSNNTSHKSSNNSGKSVTVKATAYTAHCDSGCTGTTATGVDLDKHPNKKVIAVDPDVIPLGSTVEVPGYGKAVAADTGGAINGNRIDIYKSDKGAAASYGKKTVTVKILD